MKRWISCVLAFCLVFSLVAQDKSLKDFIKEAEALQKQGELRPAIAVMQKAVAAYPKDSNAHLYLGNAWGELGRKSGEEGDFMTAMEGINKGFESFDVAIELDPQNVEALFTRGAWAVNIPGFFGKLDSGIDNLEKIVVLYEKSKADKKEFLASVYTTLAKGYLNKEDTGKAKAAFEKVLTLVPEGELAEAVKKSLAELPAESADAQQVKSGDFETSYNLGQKYLNEKKYADAIAALKEATSLDEDHIEAQKLLVEAISQYASLGYDERIYHDTNLRSALAFEGIKQIERLLKLDPENLEAKMSYGITCVLMPFFVGKIDQGIALLEEIANDESLPKEVRSQALYHLGFGYRKKGHAVWMKLVKNYPNSEAVDAVYQEYGLRDSGKEVLSKEGEKVIVTFHLGFMDELAPQTAVWVEDEQGRFVKTLYVSGFSGYAKEKQINLFDWSEKSKFETDGTTGASIDWGKHTYTWDLTDREGNKVKKGTYKVRVEVSWWPSMQYGKTAAMIEVGGKEQKVIAEKVKNIPYMGVNYLKK